MTLVKHYDSCVAALLDKSLSDIDLEPARSEDLRSNVKPYDAVYHPSIGLFKVRQIGMSRRLNGKLFYFNLRFRAGMTNIKKLQDDIEEHFQLFERVPLRAAWQRRDAKICLIWTGTVLIALSWALISLPNVMLTDLTPSLLPILIVTMICAIHMGEISSQVRAMRLGAAPTTSLTERLHLKQQWFCSRYECQPHELLDKAREIRLLWEEREDIRRLASNDTMGPRFAAFIKLPDPARFLGLLTAIAAIFATLVTLGSNLDSFFDALQDWKSITANILISTALLAELVLLWIMVTGMVREIGPSILEQAGLLPISSRRVYRYLWAMHTASEPITPFGRKLPLFLKAVALLFIPIPSLWTKARARLASQI